MKQADSQPVLHVCQGPGHLFARCGVGDAGDEVMNEILNREEPELQWMRLERRLIAMLQHRTSVEVGE